ncbi:MAG: MerR family transcriptional regulator, partial [Oscillospiraceae bacterium]
PMFNIYHVSPHETQNPDEFVTEVCIPVREA